MTTPRSTRLVRHVSSRALHAAIAIAAVLALQTPSAHAQSALEAPVVRVRLLEKDGCRVRPMRLEAADDADAPVCVDPCDCRVARGHDVRVVGSQMRASDALRIDADAELHVVRASPGRFVTGIVLTSLGTLGTALGASMLSDSKSNGIAPAASGAFLALSAGTLLTGMIIVQGDDQASPTVRRIHETRDR